jgi:D-arabinose 1-dehydrogenase-like Zn-dependent alcohol dehydrogenase
MPEQLPDAGGAPGKTSERGVVMSKKMKVWSFDRYGTPDVLTLRERDVATPGKGEVLVQVTATAVNPSDVGNVGGHFKASLPRVPGRDFAGVIVSGDGPVGTEVWGSGPGWGVKTDGSHAEYIVMPADWVSARPKNLTAEEAASIGVAYLAAWSGLVKVGNVQAGESVRVMNRLRAGFEEGVLRPPPVQTWGFKDAPRAYEAVAERIGDKKHVLKPLE